MSGIGKYLGREIKQVHIFNLKGTFQGLYAAQSWCKANGYSYGSTSVNRMMGGDYPVAMLKGKYDLPQKWGNFDKEDKARVDGVMVSVDFREGEVRIYIFN